MADPTKLTEALQKLGITLHDILRYGYGGFLAAVVAALISSDITGKVVATLTPSVTLVLLFVIGGPLYAIQRPLVGELLVVFTHSLLHGAFDRLTTWRKRGHVCRLSLLHHDHHVSRIQSLEAYRAIRDSPFFPAANQQRFHKQHSELHTVNTTIFIFTIGAIVLTVAPQAVRDASAIAARHLWWAGGAVFMSSLVLNQACHIRSAASNSQTKPRASAALRGGGRVFLAGLSIDHRVVFPWCVPRRIGASVPRRQGAAALSIAAAG